MRFRTDVQGLRAVAVIPVLLFHFGLGAVSGGFTGVDIFFVISGYVIAGSVVEDMRAGRFSIANFYFKRIRRIFPALMAVLALTSIGATAILLPEDLQAYARSVIATATFWSNIYFWRASGYFQPAAQTQPLLHTWSLSIEEQFYVFAPIAFWIIHRYGRGRWLAILAPAAVASLTIGFVCAVYAPSAGFFLLTSRAWELLIGAMVALHTGHDPRSRAAREVLSITGAAMIAVGLFWITETDPFPGWNALFPCGGAALILLAGKGVKESEGLPTVSRWLSTIPLLWVGNISYSLYLVHWPVAALVRYATLRPPTLATAAAMMVVSLTVAAGLYRYVEQPFRHIGRSHRRPVLVGGLAAMGIAVAVGGLILGLHGLPGRYPGYAQSDVSAAAEWGGGRCFTLDATRPLAWDRRACTRIHGAHGRILLWGDSFAAQYAPGILRDSARINADVLQYTFAGCPPILAYHSLARVGCALSNRAIPDLIRREQIDTVVLSARWVDTPRRTLAHLQDTVTVLTQLGVRVFVIGQSPQFIADVQQIDYLSGQSAAKASAAWPTSFTPDLNAMIRYNSRGATFIDPIAHLCRKGTCAYRIGNHYLYADMGHLSRAGSILAVKRFFPTGR